MIHRLRNAGFEVIISGRGVVHSVMLRQHEHEVAATGGISLDVSLAVLCLVRGLITPSEVRAMGMNLEGMNKCRDCRCTSGGCCESK